MELTDLSHPVWKDLVLNKVQANLNFLAANILLSRLKISLRNGASAADVENARREIFNLYYKSKDYPSARKDIQLLMSRQYSVTQS